MASEWRPPRMAVSSQVVDLGDSDDEGGNTQVDENADKFLLGFVEVNVVGLQYYSGRVSDQEMVRLIREPHNPYDRNAIQVSEHTRGPNRAHREVQSMSFGSTCRRLSGIDRGHSATRKQKQVQDAVLGAHLQ